MKKCLAFSEVVSYQRVKDFNRSKAFQVMFWRLLRVFPRITNVGKTSQCVSSSRTWGTAICRQHQWWAFSCPVKTGCGSWSNQEALLKLGIFEFSLGVGDGNHYPLRPGRARWKMDFLRVFVQVKSAGKKSVEWLARRRYWYTNNMTNLLKLHDFFWNRPE